jgi:hypothetical protein
METAIDASASIQKQKKKPLQIEDRLFALDCYFLSFKLEARSQRVSLVLGWPGSKYILYVQKQPSYSMQPPKDKKFRNKTYLIGPRNQEFLSFRLLWLVLLFAVCRVNGSATPGICPFVRLILKL